MDEDKLKEEDWMKEISRSIGEQVEEVEKMQDKDGEQDRFNQPASINMDIRGEDVPKVPLKKNMAWKKKVAIILSILLVVIGGSVTFVYAMLGQINQENFGKEPRVTTDLTLEELDKQKETMVKPSFDSEIESKVVNILLIGEESMDDNQGRSDTNIIATINTKEKTLKLTSIMRDTYVAIPGYRDNKLNAAYHNGGGSLLSETIEQNFNIKIDGYVRVDYEGFENIVDRLGGVEIEISDTEASYLNTTNYISDPTNRNIRSGMQNLNGNQALGYCRIRYRKASNGEADDFGRTYRQRKVLTEIFNQYKSTNVVNMISIVQEMLSKYVSTNMSKTQMIKYITIAAGLGTTELETFRLPVNGSYTLKRYSCGSVLEIDKEVNKAELRKFIYAGLDDEEFSDEVED